jgi:hypothetical protein
LYTIGNQELTFEIKELTFEIKELDEKLNFQEVCLFFIVFI